MDFVFKGKISCSINNCWIIENSKESLSISKDFIQNIRLSNISLNSDISVLFKKLDDSAKDKLWIKVVDVSVEDGKTFVRFDYAYLQLLGDKSPLFKVNDKFSIRETMEEEKYIII